MWGYGQSYTRQDVHAAYAASLNAGVTFVDTAEVYGMGASEKIVGECLRSPAGPAVVATKFFPFPTRLGPRMVNRAIDASLRRLGVNTIDLYQVHWPAPFIPIETLMNYLADAVEAGKLRAIGVSNYSAAQMRRAHAALARRGLPLVSNQVEYSLLQRAPEREGVAAACRELNATLIAYSPLAKGLLTGKYSPQTPPPGMRRLMFRGERLAAIGPLVQALAEIGAAHGGKTPAQVALNWLVCQGNTLPIPGVKSETQAIQNAGALGWRLTDEQVDLLRALSDRSAGQ